MGYLTNYFIQVKDVSEEDFKVIIEKVNNFEKVISYSNHSFGTYAKWYDYKDNIAYISKSFPKALFIIDCVGEDAEKWKTYIQNGKYQDAEAHITYDEFDPKKLRELKKDWNF